MNSNAPAVKWVCLLEGSFMAIAVSDIAIIIPAVNEQEHIGGAVRSAFSSGAVEILVVDGGSKDATVVRATEAGARVVKSPAGRSVQQNRGAWETDKPVLCFLHADNQLSDDALQQAVAWFNRNPANVWACFRQQIPEVGIGWRLVEWGNCMRARWRAQVYGDQCMVVLRPLFEQVGGFPEVRMMEDVLISQAFRRRGFRPAVLRGPLRISARRWKQNGLVRQTLKNWWLLIQLKLGRHPDKLVKSYVRHDG